MDFSNPGHEFDFDTYLPRDDDPGSDLGSFQPYPSVETPRSLDTSLASESGKE